MSSSWTVHEIRTLGVGSFGRVKYGKYKGDGNMYAVKFMKKHEIIKLKQVDHINAERNLMQQINHPFAVNMFGSFKDDRSAPRSVHESVNVNYFQSCHKRDPSC